jgi:hypothetical protein
MENVVVTGNMDRVTPLGSTAFRVFANDDAFEGRMLRFSLQRGSVEAIGQLLQLDRTKPLVNHLGGPYGLTGRVTLTLTTGEETAYGCRAE